MKESKQIVIQKNQSILDYLRNIDNRLIKIEETFNEWYDKNVPLPLEHALVAISALVFSFCIYFITGFYVIIYLGVIGLFVGLAFFVLYYVSPYSPYRNKDDVTKEK